MSQLPSGPRYLMRWDDTCEQRLGRDLVATTHRLGELPLFSEHGLAGIIDSYPRDAMQVNTMGTRPEHPSEYRIGHVGKLGGRQLIESIEQGRLCLRLLNVRRHHDQLGRIVQRLSREMVECQPGLRTMTHEGELEISSPSALGYFGIDVRPRVFCQIHGSRQIWVYPREAPFVEAGQIPQSITTGSGPMYFEPAFDDRARLYPQSGGDVLALPFHTPYRTVNAKQLCITLSTSYETRQSRHRNDCYAANVRLSRLSPFPVRAVESSGAVCHLKRMIVRLLGPVPDACQPISQPTFCVDPNCADCVGPLDQIADADTPLFPGVVQAPAAVYAGSTLS